MLHAGQSLRLLLCLELGRLAATNGGCVTEGYKLVFDQ